MRERQGTPPLRVTHSMADWWSAKVDGKKNASEDQGQKIRNIRRHNTSLLPGETFTSISATPIGDSDPDQLFHQLHRCIT